MPSGRYTVMDGKGRPVGTEEFRCAPGPAGWRYFATIETSIPNAHSEMVDLVVDGGWRLVRLRIETGSHDLEVAPDGERLVGKRDEGALDLQWGPEAEVDYLSPCFNAVTANRLGQSAEIDVVFWEPFTLEPVSVRQRYERLGPETIETPVGRFETTRWQFTALDTGFTRPFWLAGDVVIEYEGVFELAEYEPGSHGPVPR